MSDQKLDSPTEADEMLALVHSDAFTELDAEDRSMLINLNKQ